MKESSQVALPDERGIGGVGREAGKEEPERIMHNGLIRETTIVMEAVILGNWPKVDELSIGVARARLKGGSKVPGVMLTGLCTYAFGEIRHRAGEGCEREKDDEWVHCDHERVQCLSRAQQRPACTSLEYTVRDLRKSHCNDPVVAFVGKEWDEHSLGSIQVTGRVKYIT